MKRYAATFALFGFLASLTMGLFGEAALDEVLESALLWAGTFFLLGLAVGWAGRTLLDDVDLGLPEAGEESRQTERENRVRAAQLAVEFIHRERGDSPIFSQEQRKPADKDKMPGPIPDEAVR